MESPGETGAFLCTRLTEMPGKKEPPIKYRGALIKNH